MKASKFQKEEHQNWRNYGEGKGEERDFQRQKCYDAENSIRNGMLVNNNRLETVEEMQAFVDKICSYKWFKDRWGNKSITVKPGQRRRRAGGHYGRSFITMPIWSRSTLIVLHELAHAITPYDTGGGHGRYWAATYLELVEKVMGKPDFLVLRESFKAHGVKYTQKRRLSEATKAKMAAHMENIRAKSPIFNK
jgi:putative metallohydrolase (TIGR04338 family)